MRERRINVMHFVPSHFVQFVDSLVADAAFPDLRWLVFSGEALPSSVVRKWIDRHGTTVGLANLYGPTEASIDVTSYLIERKPEADERIPIGRAIDNVFLAVLDGDMKPCETGQMGQLWIGGIAIARGYLHDPDTTAKHFHRNPFAHVPGELLYCTGDLASQTADGVFHFHGRVDSQVKIRGFRIELGEVEAVLGAHPKVVEAAALAVDGPEDQKLLVGFVAGDGVDAAELRKFVRSRLPDYMVPHRIEVRRSLPKNSNGKLDRKALVGAEAPPVGPSIVEPAVAPTPGSEIALAPAQRWILGYFEPPHAWFGYTRMRYLQPIDVPLFERAVEEVVHGNAALRASFHRRGGQWLQAVAERVRSPLVVVDASSMSEEARDREAARQIRASCDDIRVDASPLFRVVLLVLADGTCDIVVVGHHLVSDMLSNQLLVQQTWRAYARLLGGQAPPDARPASSSYMDYVRILTEAEASGALAAHAEYWRTQLASTPPLTIPLDDPRGANVEASAASEAAELDEARTRALMNAAKTVYRRSFYQTVLAPIYRAFGEWAGRDRVVLSHRSHGRDLGGGRTFFDVVGNFAVNFPVAVDLAGGGAWRPLVDRVSAAFDALPMKGVTFDLIGDRLPAGAYPDDAWTPVRVNYLGNRTSAPSKLFESRSEDRDQRYAAPEQRRTAVLEVFLEIVDGRLRVDVSYSKNLHQQATVRGLLDRIVALLDEVTTGEASRPALARRVANGAPPPHAPTRGGPSSGAPGDTGGDPLRGRVAIVTGGGRGIGRATAVLLARSGARVVVAARGVEQVDACVEEIERAGGQALGIPTDVARQPEVERMVAQTIARFGRLDVLVNNAGITGMASLADSDPDEWRRITEVNLFGSYYCCRAAVPHLVAAGGGKIVNVGSDSSVIGYPMLSAYAASKHAVIGLTKALAEELKQQNVQVNAVCPAFVDTDMAPKAFRPQALPTARVADVILFLASRQSDGITGEMLRVYGTQDMHWYGSRKMAALKTALGVSQA